MLTNIMRLPLQTLPVFRKVAELQNLRAAADALHLTHSAVSQQIRVLEGQLGFKLFDRRGRRVVLNAAGLTMLRSTRSALAQLDDGMQAAAAAATGSTQRLRVTVLPSFAQRWLLPRMGRWRERYPHLALEIDASQQVVDLQRDGFHAALRYGTGPWAGLESERLFDMPMRMIVVASKSTARRLQGAKPEAYARESLLGDGELWERWFAAAGLTIKVTPVAVFNDAGLLLQAAEQDLGLALSRELLAADALLDGRLVRLTALSIAYEPAYAYHLVYPPSVADWPPLAALRQWLRDELELSRKTLHPLRPSRPANARGR
jgi:LysR family transcriptional regulator, glycine cleavage system transcriptional activator